MFIGGEIGLYFAYKVARNDFAYWPRVGNNVAMVVLAILGRAVVKVVADFSGCFHFRHSKELGGVAFSVSMVWAQLFPFVALLIFREVGKGELEVETSSLLISLGGGFCLWVVLNAAFFKIIDKKYLRTFFGTQTGPQYVCELFQSSKEDKTKFSAAFKNHSSYTKSIREDVKAWVEYNINDWVLEKPKWFVIEKIPDEFLPAGVLAAAGGVNRRRSSVTSVREIVGLEEEAEATTTITIATGRTSRNKKEALKKFGKRLYEGHEKDYETNREYVKGVFGENATLVAPLVERCPPIEMILAHVMVNRFGWRAQEVSWTSVMGEWDEEDCRRVGQSLAKFIRSRKTGEVAVDAWRKNYVQLEVLFEGVVGFEEFMVAIADGLMVDSVYGTVARVTTGAVLSMVDAATDINVIVSYYRSKKLKAQANLLVAMIVGNTVFQIIIMLATQQKKGWRGKLKEVLIAVFFLRPAVDAYRVSTNYVDKHSAINSFDMLMVNKGIELATESIPGCVLQLYVYLSSKKDAGSFALVSIGISALTTGYTSAMIAFDIDVDEVRRRNQPRMYGYVPNDHKWRGRCFVLMTMIGGLHNVSRSVGVSLLALTGGGRLVIAFVGGGMGLYLLFKIASNNFWWYLRGD